MIAVGVEPELYGIATASKAIGPVGAGLLLPVAAVGNVRCRRRNAWCSVGQSPRHGRRRALGFRLDEVVAVAVPDAALEIP